MLDTRYAVHSRYLSPSLPNPMISLPGMKHPYARVLDAAPDTGKQDPSDAERPPLNSPTPWRKILAWLDTLWPLVLHCVGAVGIATLLMYYVDDNHFNIRERRPTVTFADGTPIRASRFSPLQSDINTILSAALVVLRWIVTAWAGPLCWRILFFLMEKIGLRRRDLEWLIGYGFIFPSTHLKHKFIFLTAAILTSTLCAQSASPILTGSITWAPSSVSAGVHSDAFVNVSVATNRSLSWQEYHIQYVQTRIGIKAAGFANQAWGQDTEKGTLKRVLPSANRLNINTTISNITLPYFLVTAVEWISDPRQNNLTDQTLFASGLSYQGILQFDLTPGMLAILPTTWRGISAPRDGWPFPPPSTVSETRTLILNTGPVLLSGADDQWCANQQPGARISHSFPQNTGFIFGWNSCLAFARVTYTAGVGVCTNCRISSPSTVQNDTELPLEPDTMTTEALWIMSNVTSNLVLMNTSIPSPWDDIDSYVTEVLFRSYSVAWTALHEVMTDSDDPTLRSRVNPALPSLQAQIDTNRVYAWLALQLLVTVTGILFLWLQSRSKYALIGDTTMVAFDLDTAKAPKGDEPDQSKAKSLLKIEPKDGGWEVVVDPQSSIKNP